MSSTAPARSMSEKAFKLKVREHHPDRFPAGSPEQRHATEQMAAVARAQRQAAFSRAITVALSVLGVVFYVFWYAARPAWLPTGPVIGTALLWLAYLLAGQTRTGLVLWRTLDLFRMVRPTLGELNRLE